jgi:hypothetical protein
VNFGSPPQAITYAGLITHIPLGDVDQWQASSVLLQQLWIDATSPSGAAHSRAAALSPAAAPSGATAAARPAPADPPGGVYTGPDQTDAVFCTDNAGPRGVSDYEAAARLAGARAGGWGLYWAWLEEVCAHWTTAAQDRYTGPWDRPTASTILVMSLTGDPATTYQNGVAMSRDLARARLLSIDGFGHTEFANPSTCATTYARSATSPPAPCRRPAPSAPRTPPRSPSRPRDGSVTAWAAR